MAIVTASDIRNTLEGFCGIDSSLVTDLWIEDERDGYIIPTIERITRQSFSGVKTAVEVYSGTGNNTLNLRRRNIIDLIKIMYIVAGDNFRVLNITNVYVLHGEGVLKAKRNVTEAWLMPIFPKGDKNLEVTYTYGYDESTCPIDIKQACKYLLASSVLSNLEGRLGGGDLGIKDYTKSYGDRGKYTFHRNDLERKANVILQKYMTRVV